MATEQRMYDGTRDAQFLDVSRRRLPWYLELLFRFRSLGVMVGISVVLTILPVKETKGVDLDKIEYSAG
jgi:hypothetical protein